MAEVKDSTNVKRSLGRGLGSLLGEDVVFREPAAIKTPAASAFASSPTSVVDTPNVQAESVLGDHQRIWAIDIEKLTPNLYQPRKIFAPEKIQELSASIKEKGILQPIVARRLEKDKFEIIAGERRWRAAQAAGLQSVPVILKDVKNQESLELALIENLQRHDLNPIEEAEAYQRLTDEFGLNQIEVAQKVGKERATVANSLRLLALSPEVKQMLSSGEITAGHAKALLVLTDPVKQREVAKKITTEKLTVRAAEKLVQTISKRDKPDELDIDIATKLVHGLQEDLVKALGTKVEIRYSEGKGQIAIRFYSDDDLTRIVERIKG